MQVSVRSYLTAGTAAVVATGALAVAPALPGTSAPVIDLPVSTTAAVALTGFDLPLGDIIGFLQNLGVGAGIPTDILGLLPPNFVTSIITDFAGQAASLAFGAAGEVLGFVGTTIGGLLIGPDSIPARFGGAILNIPAVIGSAAQALSGGDIAGTLQTLVAGLAAPVTGIGEALIDAATSLGDFVSTTVNDLVSALPAVLLTAVQNVIGGDLGALFDQVRDVLTGLLGIGGAAATPVSAAASARPAAVAAAASVAAPESAPAAPAADSPAPADTTAVAVDVTPEARAETAVVAATDGDAAAAAPVRARRAAVAPQAAQPAAAESAAAETSAVAPAAPETAAAESRASRGSVSGTASRAGAHRGAKAAAASE